MDWLGIFQQYENSTLKIISNSLKYDIYNPEITMGYEEIIGVGFFVDISDGILITSSKLTLNAKSIYGVRSGKFINLKILNTYEDRGISICKLENTDKNYITKYLKSNKPVLDNFSFGDDMVIMQSDEVIIITHNGEDSRLITSSISHFDNIYTHLSSVIPDDINCIGAPVISIDSKVLGIMIDNCRFVSSRVVLNVYESRNKKNPEFPYFSFEWCNTNELLNKLKCLDEQKGIYLTHVGENSIFKDLNSTTGKPFQTGDILTQIIFKDPYRVNVDAYNLNSEILQYQNKGEYEIGRIDNYGYVTLYKYNIETNDLLKRTKRKNQRVTNRKIRIDYLQYLIPIGSKIKIFYFRDVEENYCQSYFVPTGKFKLNNFIPKNYFIFGGLMLTYLSKDYLNDINRLPSDYRDKPYLMVVKTIKGSEVDELDIVKCGDILYKLNEEHVNTFKDLEKYNKKTLSPIKAKSSKYLIFETYCRKLWILEKSKMIKHENHSKRK